MHYVDAFNHFMTRHFPDFFLFLVPFYMMILSRMTGGGGLNLPWGLDAWLLALPYLLFWPFLGFWTLLGYVGAVAGVRLGHGRGFGYWTPFKPGSEPEKIEILIDDNLPVKLQKILIMVGTGLAVTTIMAGLMAWHGFYVSAAVLVVSGCLKGLCYALPKTEWAEMVRGFFLGIGILLGVRSA